MAAAASIIKKSEILHLMHLITDIFEALNLETVCLSCHYIKVDQAITDVDNYIEILHNR